MTVVEFISAQNTLIIDDKIVTLTEKQRIQLHHKLRPKKNPTALSYSNWELLDDLLAKHIGCGGYYDLVEWLKTIASAYEAYYCTKSEETIDLWEPKNEFDNLAGILNLLEAWGNCVSRWSTEQILDEKRFVWGEAVRVFNLSGVTRLDKF